MSRSRSLQERLSFLGYDRRCRENLNDLQALLAPAIDGLLDDFYQFMRERPETRDLLPNAEVLAQARQAHKAHWLEILFGAEPGEAQVARALQIGRAHERIGLGLSAYLGGYCRVLNHFAALIAARHAGDADALGDKIQSVQKAVFLDIDCVIESYLDAKNASIRKILGNAEQFIAEIEQLDAGLAESGRRLPPQTEALAARLETCREQLDRLAEGLAESGGAAACHEALERLRGDFAACAEDAAGVARQSRSLAGQLDCLSSEVAARKTRHRPSFPAPGEQSLLSRLKLAAQALFPAASG